MMGFILKQFDNEAKKEAQAKLVEQRLERHEKRKIICLKPAKNMLKVAEKPKITIENLTKGCILDTNLMNSL